MSAFSPSHAVLVALHGVQTFDPAVIPLEAEDYLLVNNLSYSTGMRVQRRLTNWLDQPIYRRDADPFLNFTLRAVVTGWGGLTDAHPGPLTRQSLIFANGDRVPHQFMREAGGESVGLFYYDGASTDHAGGDTPEITVNLSLDFTGLDVINHPGTETSSGYVTVVRSAEITTVTYVDLPAESTPAVVTVAGRTQVLRLFFQGESPGTLTALRPLNGVAEMLGAALTEGWTELAEDGGNAQISIADSPAMANFGPAESAITLDGLKAEQGGEITVQWAFSAPVDVPAFRYFRIPAAALQVQLEWPWDGAEPDDKFARVALKQLMGQANTEPVGAQLLLTAWDGDPAVAGVALTSWSVDKTSAIWEVDTLGARNKVALSSPDSAPPGDWAVEYITVELPLLPGYLMKIAHSVTVLEGNQLVLAINDLDLVF